MKLDQIDLKILSHLQTNARITNAELAERVGLSPTPCLRRTRRLEQDGVIEGYHASLNREAFDLTVDVFIMVELEKEDETTLKMFEEAVEKRPEVIECYLVTGKFDYLLHVVISSLSSYETFLSDAILKLKNVSTIESTFILREIARRKALPLDGARR